MTAKVVLPQEAHMGFLRELARLGGFATARKIQRACTEKENQLRQYCRRHGWVKYTRNEPKGPEGWKVTVLGQTMLDDPMLAPDFKA